MGQSNFLIINRLSEALSKDELAAPMPPIRQVYRVVLLSKGVLQAKIGEIEYTIQPNTLFFVAPGQPARILGYQGRPEGYCVAFDIDYFLLCLKNQVQLSFYPFFQADKHPLLVLAKAHARKVASLIQKMEMEYANRKTVNDGLLAKLYLNVLLIEIARFYQLHPSRQAGRQSRKRLVASKFKQMVDRHFLTVRKVSAYADMLSIAPNYLNDIVRETTGLSASETIRDRIALEAKAHLIQSEWSVNEIAYRLHFSDSSYFCRFFRKQTGVSPQGFRATNHA